MTATHAVVTQDEWVAARRDLLGKEKELTSLRDELAAARRELPWVRVDKRYEFDTNDGRRTLADLFAGRSQLLVYHFMLGPGWAEGCPSCSFWADSFDGAIVHLANRDVTMICASRAPLDAINAYKARMGWGFEWVSSLRSDFNFDFGVSFTEAEQTAGGEYNFRHVERVGEEMPGLSAFALEGGDVYRTYSCYARGLDPINSAYQLLDLAPKGRDEEGLPWPMAWVRRHDVYENEVASVRS
jgi:predicted dithiol-disulfide oxidoreductase (DUF899 family)